MKKLKKVFIKNIKKSNINRLTIHKSNKNLYCQIHSFLNDNIITSVSTLDINFKDYFLLNFGVNSTNLVCAFFGKLIAMKCISLGIFKVFFDKKKYKYHGCLKVLAFYARKFGLIF